MFFQCISVMVLLCLSEPITANIPLGEIRHLAHLSYHFSLNSLSGDLSELAQHHVTRFQTLAIKVLPFLETIPAEMSQESQAFIKSLENEDAKNTSSDKESLHIRGMWALLHVLLQSPHAKRSGEFLLIAKTYLQETSLTEISACFKDIDYQTIYEYDSANIARLWLVEMHRKKFPSTTLYDGCTSCYVAKPTKVERNDDKVLEYLKATFQLCLFKGSVYTLFASYYESVRTGGFDEKGDQNTTSAKIYKEFASHATRLIPMLAKGHDKLTEEEEELVTKDGADCGYHCGLWKLFHTLLQKSEAPGATAEAIAEYIPYVTTGKVYSQFFKDVSQKVASGNLSLMDANAARLWLWNVHNVINEFAGHAFYPSKQQCETCVVEAIVNEPAVLEYLEKTYSNFPQVTSQKEKAKRIMVFFIPIFVCSIFLVMLGYIVRRELEVEPEKRSTNEKEGDPTTAASAESFTRQNKVSEKLDTVNLDDSSSQKAVLDSYSGDLSECRDRLGPHDKTDVLNVEFLPKEDPFVLFDRA